MEERVIEANTQSWKELQTEIKHEKRTNSRDRIKRLDKAEQIRVVRCYSRTDSTMIDQKQK